VISVAPLIGRLEGSGLKLIDLAKLAGTTPPPGSLTPRLEPRPVNELAAILYTSGTSGLPKGVPLTHGNLAGSVTSAHRHTTLGAGHTFLGVVPLFHSTGLMVTLLMPVYLGSKVVYQARFSPVAALEAIEKHQISVLTMVPAMYGALLRLKSAGEKALSSVKFCISGGEPLSPILRVAFEKRFGITMLEGYGLTETLGPVCFNTPESNRGGSVGKPLPEVKLKLDRTDAATGAVSGDDAPGELLVAGPMVTAGYHNLPEETAAAFTADGYFRTGDLARIDADGFVHITGRKKDLIIVAGEKVYPREVEDLIATCPLVGEVAVVGRKDDVRGEAVVAFVVPREGVTGGHWTKRR
jgi:long-chain acyl-CoA synthetase